MEQNKVQATTGITFRVLVALSICHCLNDTLQSVISAVYPLFKEDLGLSFAFGVAGIASAVLGNMADRYGIEAVYNVCGYMPFIGLVTWFLPDLKKKR